MGKILTKKELERQKRKMLEDIPSEKKWNEGCWEMKLINTALVLYERVEELKNELLTVYDDGVMSGMKEIKKDYKKEI